MPQWVGLRIRSPLSVKGARGTVTEGALPSARLPVLRTKGIHPHPTGGGGRVPGTAWASQGHCKFWGGAGGALLLWSPPPPTAGGRWRKFFVG